MVILMELSIIFFLTSIWVLRTPNAGQNMLFKSFLCKKVKKEEKAWKLIQNLEKKNILFGLDLWSKDLQKNILTQSPNFELWGWIEI